MPEVTHLLWIDLETTGVDEKKDEIVEVGFILTDMELDEKYSGSSVIQITENGWNRIESDTFIKNMHTESGLLAVAEQHNIELPTAREYEDFLLEELKKRDIGSHRAMLAGSGVGHFDRRFLAEWMPRLNSHLAYPVIDVGVIRRFYADLCGMEVSAINEGKTHRALDDVSCHLEEARWFRKQFSSL